MNQSIFLASRLRRVARLVLPAALLGAISALFVYGYWLTVGLMLADWQLLVVSTIVGILAAGAFLPLLGWAFPRFSEMPGRDRWLLLLLSLPVAAFLLFGGTDSWRSSQRHLNFLLPDQHLQISVVPPSASPAIELVWFNTTLGDVSYDSISARGWKRVGDALIFQSQFPNSLTWTGKTGEQVQLVFRGSATAANILLNWDGQPETLTLAKDRLVYSRSFGIPLYASGVFINALGLLIFYVLTVCGGLFFWTRRQVLLGAAEEAIAPSTPRLTRPDMLLIMAAVAAALLLRVFNLSNVFPAVDEYDHLIAAKQILAGASLSAVYPRGLWLVTLPVSAALWALGPQLWAARLVGVVGNALAVIPLYLLTRKISRPVAVLSVLLYATSPWIITFARVAREYAYYPFYFYWIIYAMVLLAEAIPAGFAVRRDWRAIITPKVLVLCLVLCIPPIFALRIDWLSTFRTILISYLMLGVVVLLRVDWRHPPNWPFLALLLVGVAIAGRAWYQEQSDKLLTIPRLNTLPMEYFLPNPQQQWYLDRAVVLIVLALLAVIWAAVVRRKFNLLPFFMLSLFCAYLAVFTLFSKTFFHTRHVLSTELWYIVVIALGLCLIWKSLLALVPRKGTGVAVLLAGLLAASVMNIPQILLPTLSSNPDMPISEDYLHDLSSVQAFMLDNVQGGDVLISTVYGQYATWEGKPTFEEQYHITSHTPTEDILALMAQHPAGWLVVDDIRFKLGSMSVRDFLVKDEVKYLGLFGDEHVWRWQRPAASIYHGAPRGAGQ
jgi:hypothetical protein